MGAVAALRTKPHSILSREPASRDHASYCNVMGCQRHSGRYVFVCGDHWALIEPHTRAALVDRWEQYATARSAENKAPAGAAIFQFYVIARRDALPQIRRRLDGGPIVRAVL